MASRNLKNREAIHYKRKRAEEAIRENEGKLRILFESISDGIIVSDLEGQIIDVNDAAVHLMGYSDKVEVIGRTGFEFITEKDRAKAIEDAMKAIELGHGPAFEYTFVDKDGREYDAEASASLLFDDSGNPVGFVSVIRDITERKRSEEALRESEEKLRVMFESTSEGIAITDLKGKILDVNDAILRMSGLSREELIGQEGYKLVPPEDSKNIMEQGMKVVKSETGTGKMSYETTPTSGRAYDVDLSISVLRDSSGDSTGFVAITRDITEHKRKDEALYESESRYRLLAENVTDIIWTMDMNLQFTYFSPSIRRLGYSVEEAVALSLDNILSPGSLNIVQEVFAEEMAIEELDRKRREGAISSQDVLNLLTSDQRDDISDITVDEWLAQRKVPWSKHRMRILEVELYLKDSSTTIWVELAVGFVRDSDGKPDGIVGIARDISERKKAEEEKLLAVTEKAAVLDSMGEGLLIIGMEGKVISCNPAFERLCGYTQGDLIGRDAVGLINVLVKAEDQQRIMANFATALKTNIAGTEYFSLISRDGREIPVATTETLVLDEEGNPTAIIAMFTDITSIRQAEAARWGSEEKLRCFMDSATDQFTIWDPELNLVDLNEAALKYPLIRLSDGANKEDFIGKNITELEPHVKERGRYDQYLEVIRTGESLVIEDVISDSKLGDIHLSVRAFKVGDGLGMITTDITENKRAERALRESEQRYRLLADNVTDIITITDLNLQLIYVSPSIERLLGYSVEEAMAETMEYFLTPASLDAAMEALAEEIAKRNHEHKHLFWTRTLEMEMTCKDGSTVWTENIVSPLHDQNSKVIGIVGVTRDIRERKQVEVALRESEEKLRRFMDSATDFFTIWDSELNLIDLNVASLNYPSIRNPNGSTKEDYIGRNILDLDPDIKERGRYDQYLEVIRTGEPLFVEDIVHRPNIGDVYLSVRAFKVGDGLGLLTMDMTDRKRAEDAIRQAEKLRALGEMAGGVAHDFNNILSVVLGRAQLALADVKDEKARRSIEIIEQTALDAAAMVRRLREVAVVKGERSFDEIDLNKLMGDTIQMVESRRLELNETEGVTIEIHSERNEVTPASGDAAELREAVVNILFNAMDAMPEGGNITMESRQEDSSVVLSISDTGTGIPEEIRGKLFDPFFSTKASKGSGLGLSVTMGIITKHGGSIDVESTEGEGTTFHIRLPMAKCVNNGSCSQSKPRIIKRVSILLVDDDPEVGMPDVSGLDVARAVKAKKPNTPVMLITGWGVQLDPEQMREIDSVIEKPFGKEALLAHMAELLPVKNGKKASHW
jgi:PAS domain S-box-containing protein